MKHFLLIAFLIAGCISAQSEEKKVLTQILSTPQHVTISNTTETTSDANFGEWYLETNGQLSVEYYSKVSVAVFGKHSGVDVTIFRRDAAGDSDLAQLKIVGAIKDFDIILNWIPSTGELYWDTQTIPIAITDDIKQEFGELDYLDNFTISSVAQLGIEKHSDYYHPGEKMYLANFLLAITSDMAGFRHAITIEPQEQIAIRNSVQWNTPVLFDGNTATLTSEAHPDIKSIRFLVLRMSADGDYIIDGVTYNSAGLDEILKDNSNLLRNMTPGSEADITFDMDGIYYALVRIYTGNEHAMTQLDLLPISVVNPVPEKWKTAGTGALRESIMLLSTPFHPLANTDMHEVEVQQHVDNPKLLRLVNPYNKNHCITTPVQYDNGIVTTTVDADSEHDYYMTVDISDPSNVKVYQCATPFSHHNPLFDKRPMYTGDAGYSSPLSMRGFLITENDMDDDSTLKIKLPWDSKFSLSTNQAGGAEISEYTDEVAYIYYTVGRFGENNMAEEISRVEAAAKTSGRATGEISRMNPTDRYMDLSQYNIKYREKAFVVAVAVDKDGNILHPEYSDIELITVPMTVNNGKSIVREGFISSTYGIDAEEFEVETWTNPIQAPGYYFLKDMYTNGNWSLSKYFTTNMTSDNTVRQDMEHYMIINCSDPENVYMEHHETGINIGDGNIKVISLAYKYLYLPDYAKNFMGQLTDNGTTRTISFPTDAFHLEIGGNTYHTNRNGDFTVTLPATSADIDDINTDNSDMPKTYYNLQGIEIKKPTAGIYIVRQGSKVYKEYIR